MRKHITKRKFPWKAVVTGLGIVGSLILIGETTYKVWMWVNRPLLEPSYIAMTGDCLDRFMTTKPLAHDAPSKSQFAPNMGLNPVLQAAYSDIDIHGATVASAVFLVLRNVTDRQIPRLEVVTPGGASAVFHVASQEQVLVCVRITYKTGKTTELSISKINFQSGEGQNHATVVDSPNIGAFTSESPTSDCLMFGSAPSRSADAQR
jgi:hypothetical protein